MYHTMDDIQPSCNPMSDHFIYAHIFVCKEIHPSYWTIIITVHFCILF